MGSNTSRHSAMGAPANPRVVYNEVSCGKTNKSVVLDTPVLVDVQHGSIRYRYHHYPGEPHDIKKRVEHPNEGKEEKVGKSDYFYHSRLKDYSKSYGIGKEEKHKLLYVKQGPVSCQKKKVFYVYGIGMNAKDGMKVKPSHSKELGDDFAWPGLRLPGNVYYKINVIRESGTEEENTVFDDVAHKMSSKHLSFQVSREDSVIDLKRRIAPIILKPASCVHVCHMETELSDELKVGELCDQETFDVSLDVI